nr:amidohydrolase [Streptomyces sp. SID3343]
MVLYNGHVFTGDPGRPRADAVAVGNGRILAVGSVAEVREHAGAATETVDLSGRMALPGFQDAHIHPVQGGLERLRCDLTGEHTAGATLTKVAEYGAANPDLPWVLGGGWSMEAFPGGNPSGTLLDTVVPDRPAYLLNRDHHAAWVNGKALELAGITRDTPDPADGRIERTAAGDPAGVLHEGAMALVERHVPAASADELTTALLAAQEYLHSLGVTAWQDALIGTYAGVPDAFETYLAAAESGRLTARVAAALWWDRSRGREQIAELAARRDRSRIGRFRAETVKVMQDGVAENFTAAMSEPYLDRCGCRSANLGHSYLEPAALNAAFAALADVGFQIHVHAIGDRAVRETLDAFAHARTVHGHTDLRHHIAHLQVVHTEDLPRFADLDVTATVQPLWACHEPQMDTLTIPFLGAERAARQYPFAGLAAAGARLAAGSDWPVSSPDPMLGIHVAVNRVAPGATAEPLIPEQRITLGAALRAYTAGSAYVNHRDDTGVLRPGALADIAVLNRDPFEGPVDDIASTTVDATFVGGRCVWDRTR